VKVVVKKRYADFHAAIFENEGYWGAGETQDEAVGSLVRAHPAKFGIELVDGKV